MTETNITTTVRNWIESDIIKGLEFHFQEVHIGAKGFYAQYITFCTIKGADGEGRYVKQGRFSNWDRNDLVCTGHFSPEWKKEPKTIWEDLKSL